LTARADAKLIRQNWGEAGQGCGSDGQRGRGIENRFELALQEGEARPAAAGCQARSRCGALYPDGLGQAWADLRASIAAAIACPDVSRREFPARCGGDPLGGAAERRH